MILGKKLKKIIKMTDKIKYASFWERVLALLIDTSIYLMLITLAIFKITGVNDFASLLNNIYDFVLLNLFLAVFIFPIEVAMVSFLGGTPGKLIIGIRIQKESGKLLNWKEAFIRLTLGKAVSGLFFGLGYVWIFRDEKKRAWHDYVNNSVVAKKNNYGWIIGFLILCLFLFINFETVIGIVASIGANSEFYSSLIFG
ncbi:MAG: hypothetical protein UT39_C0025G0008 [Candidatus Woesebacteria bacterium GW2011_GWA1_39_21]|uniref:RDD domain-containing protein n=1 Tax=Candidatus Woesebacteria bacterium GW2011_GWA1_39_21 TaxID=1618550 RepID=A0A0G0QHQ1_9BACT|nr:MAG: hypothetical protein UT39_C0025G0008 [Candidatus Woesebacteria bacterium GW2011_GWA1_39_21]